MRLPIELCEAILDSIPPEDSGTLQNSALVCRFFALRAQKILFRKILLERPTKQYHNDQLRKPTEEFLSVINDEPRLAGCVEEVEITDNISGSYREVMSWIRRDAALPVILDKLDNVQRLSILGQSPWQKLNFGAWSWNLKHTILVKCQSPLLTHISLSCVHKIPTSILADAPALRSLHLVKCAFIIPNDSPPPTRRACKIQLKTLELTMDSYREWNDFYCWLRGEENNLDFTKLTVLGLIGDPLAISIKVKDSTTSTSPVSCIVGQCAATLRHLSLFYRPYVPFSPSSQLDLPPLSNLRSLTLHGMLHADRYPEVPHDCIPWLVAALYHIPPALLLERISIVCAVGDNYVILSQGMVDWESFGAAIERLAETIKVDVLVLLFEPYVPDTKAAIEDRLSGLCELGIVLVRQATASEAVIYG